MEIAVQLEDDGAAWEYEMAFHQDRQRRPRIRRERVRRGDKTLVDRPSREDAADPVSAAAHAEAVAAAGTVVRWAEAQV